MPEILSGLAWWQLALAVVVTVISAARITRLITFDTFPPVVKFRIWWDKRTRNSLWNSLFHCLWCFGFWATALVVGSFFLTFLAVWIAWAWWLLFGTLALSYLVSQYVYFDEGKSTGGSVLE